MSVSCNSTSSQSSQRIAIIEDEPVIGMLLGSIVETLGYDVAANVTDVTAGLQCAQTGWFDLAILDVNLNGVGSFPIADALTARNIPFLLSSGYSLKELPERFRKCQILQKPFGEEELKYALQKLSSEKLPESSELVS